MFIFKHKTKHEYASFSCTSVGISSAIMQFSNIRHLTHVFILRSNLHDNVLFIPRGNIAILRIDFSIKMEFLLEKRYMSLVWYYVFTRRYILDAITGIC